MLSFLLLNQGIKVDVLVRGTHPTSSGASTDHEFPDLLWLAKGWLIGDSQGHIIHGHPIAAVGCILCTMYEPPMAFLGWNQMDSDPVFKKKKL
jgi:hypothetical protein